mmetsp:Transcript_805/g.1477  ORF Transcript_805/g.1477 Transcript_805/m.1477 type:complete len:306 (+) Transcript_805:49-966(+)
MHHMTAKEVSNMSGAAVMGVTEDFNKKVSIKEDGQQQHPMESMKETGPNNSAAAGIQPPVRRLQRNKSGPQGSRLMGVSSSGGGGVVAGGPRSRAPPQRSKSHKIGRPTFDPTVAPAEPVRGVNRSKSGRVKGPPGRTASFNRRVPDRSSSTSSLRQRRSKVQQPQGSVAEVSDDISVTDSVFTSASIQTLDSIAVRKKQIDHDVPVVAGMRGQRSQMAAAGGAAVEFDESLHTVDSMHLNHKHVSEEYYDDEYDDLSVFSESFGSTESCEVLSDFEEDEMDGAIEEIEDEATMKSDEGDQKVLE